MLARYRPAYQPSVWGAPDADAGSTTGAASGPLSPADSPRPGATARPDWATAAAEARAGGAVGLPDHLGVGGHRAGGGDQSVVKVETLVVAVPVRPVGSRLWTRKW